MTLRSAWLFLFFGLVMSLGSCRGCRDSGGPGSIIDLASVDAPGAVWAPSLGDLAKHADAFVTRATQKAGAQLVRRTREGIAKQFGFDPLKADDYVKVGVDAGRGALIFLESGHREPLLALAVKDETLFDTSLKGFIAKSDGADKVSEETRHGRRVLTAGRPFGTEVAPAMHWAHVGDFAVVARADGKEALDQLLTRLAPAEGKEAAPPGLGSEALFQELRPKVPQGSIMVFVRGKAVGTAGAVPARGAMTAVKVGGEGVAVDSFLDLPVPGLESALGGEPTLPLAGKVDDDATLVALTRAAKPDGVQALLTHPATAPYVKRALTPLAQATGLQVEQDVLPLLAGPLTLSVHISDLQGLPQRLQRRSMQALLDTVHVAITAELKQAEGMTLLLDRSQAELLKRDLKIRKRTAKVGDADAIIYEPERDPPRLGWAVYKGHYVYGAGEGRLQKALERLGQGPSSLAEKLQAGVGGKQASQPGRSVLVARLGVLAENAARVSLGDSLGTQLGVGALVGSAVELLRTIGDVTLSLQAEPAGLRLELREQLQ